MPLASASAADPLFCFDVLFSGNLFVGCVFGESVKPLYLTVTALFEQLLNICIYMYIDVDIF